MQKWLPKNPYTAAAVIFLIILVAGRILWGWGSVAFAYFLLFYCIVAVAIKLDEIAASLNSVAGLLRKLVVNAAATDRDRDNSRSPKPPEIQSMSSPPDNPAPSSDTPDRIDHEPPTVE
jgi:hypothetical protein